jgi:hypothetical protein
MSEHKTKGQLAYEEDVRRRPYYFGKEPRKPWEQLSQIAKDSWERNPNPLFER